MAWRLAGSLVQLRDQVNQLYPGRSKASDGTIGDTAHAASVSDHNPLPNGVVCAFDITHDPAHGLDIDTLSDQLTASRDPRIKYLIANAMIMIPPNWAWQRYTGSNPHTSHLHVSVGGNYDDSSAWKISNQTQGGNVATAMTPDLRKLLYNTLLNREPEAAIGDAWLNMPLEEAFDRIARSPEAFAFRQKAGMLEVQIAELKLQLAQQGGGEDTELLNRLAERLSRS